MTGGNAAQLQQKTIDGGGVVHKVEAPDAADCGKASRLQTIAQENMKMAEVIAK